MSRRDRTVMLPPEDTSALEDRIRDSDGNAVSFYVAESPLPIAIMPNNTKPFAFVDIESEEVLVVRLLRAGLSVVVWVALEAPGTVVARCYSLLDDAIDEAACGVFAYKVLQRREESSLMTFHIWHIGEIVRDERGATVSSGEAAWVTARSRRVGETLSVDVTRHGKGRWSALQDELARHAGGTERAIIVADVDWAQAYSDAYGHEEGDLMLLRVHACIESAALNEGATFVRRGGDDFVIVIEGPISSAAKLAESIRRDVEALDIRFEHSGVETYGRVTVSVAVAYLKENADVRDQLDDAVYQAKRAGRNTVVEV